MLLETFLAVLCAASLGTSLELRERTGEPRVIKFDITKNDIPDRVEHDRRRLGRRANTINAKLDNEVC